jgi:hypothetical protein
MRGGPGQALVAPVTYHATVTRGDRYWVVRVLELDRATQARHLRELETMTRDLIAVMTGAAPDDSFSVEFEIALPELVKAHLDKSHQLREAAVRAQLEATSEARAAAQELHQQGVPLRDIGTALGVSFQRAHQLVS